MSIRVFWIALALIAYAYALYPLLIVVLARYLGRTPKAAAITPPLTVVIAARNEQDRIAGRVRDVLAQDYPSENLRVIVVSDGSSDDTARAADIDDPRVHVVSLPINQGKAAALNAAFAHLDTELVAFTDARQRYAPQALRKLVEAFADDEVGAVSGELEIMQGSDPARSHSADIGLYWRMEKALREGEARLGWLHGVSGAIYAVRRELVTTLPPGTILDDMYLPLEVVFAGRRVWMSREAIAIDIASTSEADEFRRKLRTLAGNWQLMARLPQLLNPFANPVFFAFCSHKLLRLIVPWALLAMLAASARAHGVFFRIALIAQLMSYAGAAAALVWPRITMRVPLLRTAGTFVMLNAAALLSLPAFLTRNSHDLWKRL